MKKVESTNGKVEFLFCIDVDESRRVTRSVYKNAQDEYFLIESEEYHIGSAYDYVDTYFLLDKSEADFYEKIALDRERRLREEREKRERSERENRTRLRTAGDDRYFYKKKKSDTVWWLKAEGAGHKFSFDKEKVFDLMRDYPDQLSPEQKEIFDRENPLWARKLKKTDG